MLFKGVLARYIVVESERHVITHGPEKPDWSHTIQVEPGEYDVTGEYDHSDGVIRWLSIRIHVAGEVVECSDGEHIGQVWQRSQLVEPAELARQLVLRKNNVEGRFKLSPEYELVESKEGTSGSYEIRLSSKETLAEIDAALRTLDGKRSATCPE